MFGNKKGKIHLELNSIVEELESINNYSVASEKEKAAVAKVIERLRKVSSISDKIHDIIEQQL